MSFARRIAFIVFSVINSLAIILTLLRLYFRLQIRRFWWEDAWAAVVLVCGTAFTISQFVSSETTKYETAFATSLMASSTATSVVWTVRMSLLYSIIRVISPSSVLRNFARVVALFFFIFSTTLIALKIWWCISSTISVPRTAPGQQGAMCVLPELIIFFEVTTDCISDAVLVILPLKLLWRVKLPRRQRRMILTLFSSTAVMSVISLFHAIFQLVPKYTVEYVVAFNLEVASTLIVCNLLVVVTYIYRAILRSPSGSLPSVSESSSEDDDFTTCTPARGVTQLLTTVDLNTLGTTNEITCSDYTSGTKSSAHQFNEGRL